MRTGRMPTWLTVVLAAMGLMLVIPALGCQTRRSAHSSPFRARAGSSRRGDESTADRS